MDNEELLSWVQAHSLKMGTLQVLVDNGFDCPSAIALIRSEHFPLFNLVPVGEEEKAKRAVADWPAFHKLHQARLARTAEAARAPRRSRSTSPARSATTSTSSSSSSSSCSTSTPTRKPRSPAFCKKCHMPYCPKAHICDEASSEPHSFEDCPTSYLAGHPEEKIRRKEEAKLNRERDRAINKELNAEKRRTAAAEKAQFKALFRPPVVPDLNTWRISRRQELQQAHPEEYPASPDGNRALSVRIIGDFVALLNQQTQLKEALKAIQSKNLPFAEATRRVEAALARCPELARYRRPRGTEGATAREGDQDDTTPSIADTDTGGDSAAAGDDDIFASGDEERIFMVTIRDGESTEASDDDYDDILDF